jgi:hypothetical protein
MNNLKILAATVALVAGTGLMAQPAQSQNFLSDLFSNYGIGTRFGGDRVAANQALISSNFQTRYNQLTSEIQSHINSGQLTPEEASILQAELNRINNMQLSYSAGGFTNMEAQMVVDAFSSLTNQLQASASNTITVNNNFGFGGNNPYGYGYGWRNGSYYLPNYNSVTQLQNSILTRINRGLASGHLTQSEANRLRNDYNQISRQINRRTVRGNINMNPVVRRLMALDRDLTRQLRDNQVAGSRWWNNGF